MFYIQRRDNKTRETVTVDESPKKKEADAMMNGYRATDPDGQYSVAKKPCKNWS